MIAEAILRGADAVDALKKFDPKVRAKYMNASEAMTCIRKQWYAKNDAEKDGPENWGYARRGHAAEHYMVSMLKAANVPMEGTGDHQWSIQDDDLMISCTPDGLVQFDDEWYAVEFKSIDPRVNKKNLPREEHVRQVQIAAAMIEKHLDLDLQIKGCVLIYINASDYNDIEEYRVPLKPNILDQLKGRANRLLRASDATRLQREGKDNGGAECRQRCPFNKVCGIAGAATTAAQGIKGGADVAQQVDVYLRWKEQEEDAKAKKNQAAELIKAQMQKSNVADVEVDGHLVTLRPRAGSISYAKAIKELMPEADLEAYRGAPTEVLTIK